jgi:hypothetical protein
MRFMPQVALLLSLSFPMLPLGASADDLVYSSEGPGQLKAGATGGALTWIFTDRGAGLRRINGIGQDACSYEVPSSTSLTSTAAMCSA